jgi:single-stranded-DNA-specific exonuclease
MNSGRRYKHWIPQSTRVPSSHEGVADLVRQARQFQALERLDYGDHGLHAVLDAIAAAIEQNKRIALYADYDVDGTMSCVSWIWFLQAIGYENFVHYIPCRFKEGYGVNLDAIRHLVESEQADVVITMDTGITANAEAQWCRERGVTFICTDHHKIQPEKMPDCLILNPKTHPDSVYQELCGCGITFVLLRKLAQHLPGRKIEESVWTDILALTGMATVCDVVPLNGVNHKLVKYGVDALMRSRRPVLVKLRAAASIDATDEKDVGFRLGPRINAVGRLEHADLVIKAFIDENPDELITFMGVANERRRQIQTGIIREARQGALRYPDASILFLGGDWHPGVVGIAASKLTEEHWRPTWLFQRKDGFCKGSARSIKGFDVTEAMMSCGHLFTKFGGHAAAGGFSFPEAHEDEIRSHLMAYADELRGRQPDIWESRIDFDCELPEDLLSLQMLKTLDDLRPFGHGFEEPRFKLSLPVRRVQYFFDKATGEPKHTCVIAAIGGKEQKILFFNEVITEMNPSARHEFLVTLAKNTFRGVTSLSMMGVDWTSSEVL